MADAVVESLGPNVIDRYMILDKHRVWGWVIFRCTYDSDEDWDKFMDYMRRALRKALERNGGLDLLDSCSITVIEDEETLDDASTAFVREEFKKWCCSAPQQEQGTGPTRSQRYQFYIQIEEESLHSVLHEAPSQRTLIEMQVVMSTSSGGIGIQIHLIFGLTKNVLGPAENAPD
jgi:hypothetical protein